MGNIENKNLYRLAKLGLQTIGNHHDVNRDLSKISNIAKEKNIPEIVELVKYIRINLDKVKHIQYQKETAKIKDVDVLYKIQRVIKYFKDCREIEYNVINNFVLKNVQDLLFVQSLINVIECFNSRQNKKILITIDTNEIIISDEGDGIPDEIKDKIFDLYFTTRELDKISSSVGGIGLYTAKSHLNDIGCDITVENNTILKGANFKIKTK